MKSSLTKLSLALLSAAFLLGCQDLGSGPVGPDGLVPQFAKKCPSPPCGGGEGGTTTFEGAITNDDQPDFNPDSTVTTPLGTTVPVDNKFNTGNNIAMNPVDVVLSDGTTLTLHLTAFSVRKRQGKLVSAKVWVGNGGTNKFATDYLPADPPVTISDSGFTLHVHAENAEFVRLHDTSGTVAFRLNIVDIVYTPAP